MSCKIAILASLVVVLGCESSKKAQPRAKPAPAPVAPAVTSAQPAPEPLPAPDPVTVAEPKALGNFHVTFYYVIGEDEVGGRRRTKAAPAPTAEAAEADGTELAAVAPPEPLKETVTVYRKNCTALAEVSREFAKQLALQGTGILRDGRMLNVAGHCDCPRSPCFHQIESKWGRAGSGRPLQPFRTVAVDRSLIKLGSLLYVPELEGRTMPGRPPWGGFVHDGCLIADDTGGGIKGKQLDFFVGRKPYLDLVARKGPQRMWARSVAVFDGSKICEREGRHVGRKSGSI